MKISSRRRLLLVAAVIASLGPLLGGKARAESVVARWEKTYNPATQAWEGTGTMRGQPVKVWAAFPEPPVIVSPLLWEVSGVLFKVLDPQTDQVLHASVLEGTVVFAPNSDGLRLRIIFDGVATDADGNVIPGSRAHLRSGSSVGVSSTSGIILFQY